MRNREQVIMLIIAAVVLTFILTGGQSHAKVAGSCGTCHTMHNSQNGATVRGGNATAQAMLSPQCATCHAALRPDSLLKMDCLGCHAKNPNGADNVDATTGAPQVAHSTTDLAAGNFKHVFAGNDSMGHNIHGFFPSIQMDMNMIPPDMPPGYDAGLDYGGWSPSGVTQNPLMCAGTNGCHGNRSEIIPLRAIKGAHHTDDTILKFGGSFNQAGQGGTVGLSYRYLYGVQGGEDADWEKTYGAGDHNEYKGDAWASRGGDPRATHSISSLCSTCHGSFHAAGPVGIGTGASPWIRHPSDYGMKTTGEFSSYSYTAEVPVARVTLHNPPDASVAVENDRIVMCLSCHKPHASANEDALRWQYDATMATPNGCYNCHRNK